MTNDILVPYTVTSENGACNSDRVISEFFNPSTRIAVTMRASFARTLGYNTSQTFVKGIIACDGRFVAVNKTDPINVASPELSLIGDELSGNSSSISSESRRLLLGLRRLQVPSASASPEPNVFLNSLNISLDGETLVVQLGVSVPAILAQSLSQYLSLAMTNASSASIAAAAAAVAAVMASPAYTSAFAGSSSTNAVSPLLASFVQNSASGGASALDLRLAMKNAITPALSLMGPIFNLTNGSSLSSGALPELIRVEDTNSKAQASPVVVAPPFSDLVGGGGGDSGTDLPLLGLLALIPIACCFALFLWRRHSEDEKKKKKLLLSAQAKDLALHTVDSGADNNNVPEGWAQNPMYKAQERTQRTKDSGAGEAPEGGVENNLNEQAKDIAPPKEDSGLEDAESQPTGLKLRAINISFEPTSVA